MAAKESWGALLACMLAAGFHAPAPAQPKGETVKSAPTEAQIRERNTNRSLLAALLERRADLVRSGSDGQEKRVALDFLDKRIAQVRGRLTQE
jgi:hypothetical protein